MLVLSLFPGIGLMDRGFEAQGFCVVRGPDLLWGGDVRSFHPPAGRFEGVIGGPPCQMFSRLRHIVSLNRVRCGDTEKYLPAENLIPEFERCVREARPDWLVMENVPAAPPPEVPGYEVHSFLLNNRWLGETQNRLRRISFGTRTGAQLHVETIALEPAQFDYAVCAAGGASVPVAIGGSGKKKRRPKAGANRSVAEMSRLQGLPENFLADSPLTVEGKRMVIGNGMPLPMARAIARAVRAALGMDAMEVADARWPLGEVKDVDDPPPAE
jgi:DNA (cytosine-5)-methyltransferase 1